VTFEVMGLEIGTLRVRDVRAGVSAARPGAHVGVLVLGSDGEPPFVGAVALVTKRSGHSEHLALLCPACKYGRSVLYVRAGRLACAGCSGRRTRRQSERTLATWKTGGREEDRLLRLVGRGRPLEQLRALADELANGDLDRAAVASDNFQTAILCIEART
jgi:hypothetical protein